MVDIIERCSEKRKIIKRHNVLLSSFTLEEKENLARKIKSLGGTYIDTPHFAASCSHIICGKPNRGEKFLCGCATGKWILKREYIEDSFKAKRWLDEETFEWNEQCSFPGISHAHMSAPLRWRTLLQYQKAPFHQWKVLVVVADAKRRIAYKRLLDAGHANLLNGKPPYPSKMAKKLTHVFVEKALEQDVKELRNAGIPCLSPNFIPEYILQDPKPSLAAYAISTYTVEPLTTSKKGSGYKNTPVFPIGAAGIPKTKSRIKELISLCPMKRLAEFTANKDPSPPKKRKEGNTNADIFPEWLDTFSVNAASLDVDLTKRASVQNSKSPGVGCTFPSSITNTIDSYLEEGHEMSAISMAASFMSRYRHPCSILIHTIMNTILLRSSTASQANKAYITLQRLLILHPPPLKSSMYQEAMCSPTDVGNGQVEKNGSEWELFSKVIRISLGLKDEYEDLYDSINQRQLTDNGLLLLKFLTCLLEKDFYGLSAIRERPAAEGACQYWKSLVWKMLWPNGPGAAVNCNLRQLLKLTWTAALRSQEDTTKIPALQSLQCLVTMVAICCRDADDEPSLPEDPNSSGAVIGTRMSSLATEMILTCGRTHKDEGGLRVLLDTCRPAWLRMQVTEMMLSVYDDCLVPQGSKYLLARGLSLEKIVSCYFYLLPREARGDHSEGDSDSLTTGTPTVLSGRGRRAAALQVIADASRTRENLDMEEHHKKHKKLSINRRNIRGETPLHVAAIHNDASKVRDLVASGADVNLADNAGWTPLHEACNHGHVTCVQEILRVRPLVYGSGMNDSKGSITGLNILATPLCGTTPLHDAVGNDHLDVSRLLVAAGGLPLLEAKNVSGHKPVDLAASCVMKRFLLSAERNLNKTTEANNERTLPRPTEDLYQRALGRKGRNMTNHISPEKCQQHLLLLSHLLDSYVRVHHLGYLEGPTLSKGPNADGSRDWATMKDFGAHLENLRRHVSRMISASELTPLCRVRLETMKLV